MTIRRISKDPRRPADRRADQEVLERFERGEILQVSPRAERKALQYVEQRYQARRDLVGQLGRELGILRRAHRLTQQQIARVVGTTKSNISRLESGRYGGLTVERFIAVLDAFGALAKV